MCAALVLAALAAANCPAAVAQSLVAAIAQADGQSASVDLRFISSVPAYRVEIPSSTEFDLYFSEARDAIASSGQAYPQPIRSVTTSQSGALLKVALVLTVPSTVHIERHARDISLHFQPVAVLPAVVPGGGGAVAMGIGTRVMVVPLQYAKLDEVAQVLSTDVAPSQSTSTVTSMFSQGSGVSGGVFSTSSLPVATGPVNIPAVRNAERITANVAIDRRLNAVILTGSADEIAALAQEIKAIDLPDAKHISVQIEAQVVELTHSSAAQLGLDFSNNGAVASASISSQTLSTAFASAQFQAKLFATIQRGEGHLLSSPRLSTLDDTEASILTGDALPIITTITYPGNPPTVQEQLQYEVVPISWTGI